MAQGKGGGRKPNITNEKLICEVRMDLLQAVKDDCAGKEVNPRKLFWAEKFANRLLPQQQEIKSETQDVVLTLNPEDRNLVSSFLKNWKKTL